MIKYHGTPITPMKIFNESVINRNVLIPFTKTQDLKRALKICNKIIIDNGAYTLWRQGGEIDWDKYYSFLEDIKDKIEFFFIPDVIDGTEKENDKLIDDYLKTYFKNGVPIWHVNESFERLENMIKKFDYIAIGSAGEYRDLGTFKWHRRMNDVMSVLCNEDGTPKVKIHMLRCLDPKIFMRYPFHSGDSTNLAQNHARDGWKNILNRIEPFNSPLKYGEIGGLFA